MRIEHAAEMMLPQAHAESSGRIERQARHEIGNEGRLETGVEQGEACGQHARIGLTLLHRWWA